jgi:hypothetical protein
MLKFQKVKSVATVVSQKTATVIFVVFWRF